ncbi:MAG: hypothetical protein JNM94_10850 [Phycisphaerae bacterium]|nr:hypothetical protein [Phycisphaerae bacterium]
MLPILALPFVVTLSVNAAPGDECDAAFASNRAAPGLYLRVDMPARTSIAGDGGVAGGGCEPIATGLLDPGPVWRDGNRLYVGNTKDNTAKTITIIDVSVAGAEFVVETVPTPVNPVDIAVAFDRLYVIDQDRNKLYSRPLAGGEWTFLAIPNGTITEWDYGHIIEPFGDRMYVIHQWENKITVVNLVTNTIETTITNLDHLPDRIVFVNDGGVDKMVVLGVGLDAPSCAANGPNFSVFDVATNQKLYKKSIAGACPSELLADDEHVYVFFDNKIRRYDLSTGAFEDELAVASIGRNAVHRGTDIVGQRYNGEIVTIDLALDGFEVVCDLVTGQQIWFPPIEQMVAMPESDGRVFVTNRNNNTTDRVTLAVPCPADLDGDGNVGPGDLGVLLGAWGGAGPADLSGDGIVGAEDLGLLLGAWGACG